MTSQIFANIYLNEFDRFVQHSLKPSAYVRYGDDFIIIENDFKTLVEMRGDVRRFLSANLGLATHQKHDILLPVRRGVQFLGMEIFPCGKKISLRTKIQVVQKISDKNKSSYLGFAQKLDTKFHKKILWQMIEPL